jgi:hypothetical protein
LFFGFAKCAPSCAVDNYFVVVCGGRVTHFYSLIIYYI